MKLYVKIAVILLVILVVVGGGGILVVRAVVLARMSPEQREAFKAWDSKPLELDEGALNPAPFPAETVRAAEEFLAVWETHKKEAFHLSSTSGPVPWRRTNDYDLPEWQALLAGTRELEPLFQAMENLVNQPDYEFDVVFVERGQAIPPETAVRRLFMFQMLAKTMAWRAVDQALAGDMAGAFRRLEALTRAARVREYEMHGTRLVANACVNIAAAGWERVLDLCEDPQALRQGLERQNALRSHLPRLPDGFDGTTLDALGTVVQARREGVAVELRDGMTGREISIESLRVEAEYLRTFVLPNAEPGFQGPQFVEAKIAVCKQKAAWAGGPAKGVRGLLLKIASPAARPLAFMMITRGGEVSRTRVTLVKARFDVLRMNTARKLYRLEKGAEPTTFADLVPDYLPEIPVDIFDENEGPMGFDPRAYSIGPDGQDQEASILYDATNGTTSAGDVLLRARSKSLKVAEQ